MLSTYQLIALITYTSWKVWVVSDRYRRIDKKINYVLVLEAFYALSMIYLLSVSSPSFLTIAILTALIHFFFGFYVEVFRPEVRLLHPSQRDILLNFWFFLGIDTTVTFLSYFLMIGG